MLAVHVRPNATKDTLAARAEPILRRCLEKNPADRYPTAKELADDLRTLLATGAATARTSAFATRQQTTRRRVAVAGIAVVLAALAIAGWLFVAPSFRVLDEGYDLRESDLRADRTTRQLVGLALRADADGNRPKAIELLEEARYLPHMDRGLIDAAARCGQGPLQVRSPRHRPKTALVR